MNRELNTNLVKIVDILSDGKYHDGTTIGDSLKLTRSAVWKTIKKLESNHIKIDSIKGKGYALLEPLALLNINKIIKKLANPYVDLSIFESIASTNEYLKTFKHSKAVKFCLAEQQTQGKGRLGREWYSPFGKNVYLSCLYPFQKDVSELSGLSLVVSLAILKTLKNSGIHEHLFVKWPNDIIYANKKLSGSLIELQAETHSACQVIIGIGVNVNMLQDEDHQISQPWVSMQKILNTYVDRNDLCANLINNLVEYLAQFERVGLSTFTDEWMQADCLAGKTITVNNANDQIQGKMVGINAQGHLLLQFDNNETRAFSSGDTSIVKK